MNVGWIGLGQIGEPMALRVLAAGHVVTGHSRPGHDRSALVEAGARITSSLQEAVAGADVVIAALFDDAQMRQVFLEHGALAAMKPGAVLAVHTTGEPAALQELAEAAGPVQVVDATLD